MMHSNLVSVSVERRGSVAEVTLSCPGKPGKANTMGPDFWREVPEVFADFDRDPGLRAILVRGSAGHFSYGLDLKTMGAELATHLTGPQLADARTRLLDLIGEMQRAFRSIAACKKPVIAAISGWCIGGGLDLISACDIRIASADAKFSLREVKLAMVADLGSLQRLPAIIGEGRARDLALTGRDIDADQALGMGLVTQVFASEETLFDEARALAAQVAKNPPLVVQGIKQVMNERLEKSVAEGLRHVALWNVAFLSSEDLQEALASFATRRAPEFKGR